MSTDDGNRNLVDSSSFGDHAVPPDTEVPSPPQSQRQASVQATAAYPSSSSSHYSDIPTLLVPGQYLAVPATVPRPLLSAAPTLDESSPPLPGGTSTAINAYNDSAFNEPESATLTTLSGLSPPSKRSGSTLTTVFYTARTAPPTETPSRASTTRTFYTARTSLSQTHQVPEIMASATSSSANMLDDTLTEDSIFQGNIADYINFEELENLPPYLPEIQPYLGLGRSLREAVIARQNFRTCPPIDPVQRIMEERLARWRPPQSESRMNDILNGKHPYQSEDLPFLEVQDSKKNDEANSSNNLATSTTLSSLAGYSSSTQPSSTSDSSIERILRSPFLDRSISLRVGSAVSTAFQEHNDEPSTSALMTGLEVIPETSSIQNSPEYLYEDAPRSPSLSSSIILALNRDGPNVDDNVPMAKLVTNEQIEAMMKKDQPTSTPEMTMQTPLQRAIQEYIDESPQDEDCATLCQQTWKDLCEDTWEMCCKCGCFLMEFDDDVLNYGGEP